ncbi:MAG: hypothetical protein ABW168_09030 [Sedimenticola sp.]
MTHPITKVEMLQALIDSLEEEIISTSDEEISEEVLSEGRTMDDAVAGTRKLIGAQIKLYRQKKLKAAKEGCRRSIIRKVGESLIPDDPSEQRSLLHRIVMGGCAPRELTMAFREGKEMSDEDVAGVLEDLRELGLLAEKDNFK